MGPVRPLRSALLVMALAASSQSAQASGDAYPDVATVDALPAERLEYEAKQRSTSDPIFAWIALRLAKRALHVGDTRGALEWARRGRATPITDHPATPALRALEARVSARLAFDGRKVGLLVPLSGPYGGIGRAVQRTVQWAAARHPQVQWALEDTHGRADDVPAAIDRLVHEHNVAAIIGPIGTLEAAAAAQVAERLEVPLVTLSTGADVTAPGTFALRQRTTYAREGAALAEYAVQRLGLHTFGVLYVRSEAGLALRDAFWARVEKLGGEVRAAEGYDDDSKADSDAVKRLAGRAPVEARRGEARDGSAQRWAEINRKARDPAMKLTPRVDFEAVFVADPTDQARRVLPFLGYWDIELRTHPEQTNDALWSKYGGDPPPLVQLLLTRQFADPETAHRAGEAAHNAVFIADFSPATVGGAAFADAWADQFSGMPTPLDAHAFDATGRVLTAIEGATSRAEVLRRLLESPEVSGAAGPARFDARGDLAALLAPMTIDAAGGVVVLEEASALAE